VFDACNKVLANVLLDRGMEKDLPTLEKMLDVSSLLAIKNVILSNFLPELMVVWTFATKLHQTCHYIP
jgi:NhaP-type Na+/H+ and K+/H+ antiporter